jgi:hypothetical protein
MRSSEWAAYRLTGTSARTLIILQGMEQLIVAGVFAAGTSLASLVLSAHLISPQAVVFSTCAAAGIWLIIAVGGGCITALRSPISLAKDG